MDGQASWQTSTPGRSLWDVCEWDVCRDPHCWMPQIWNSPLTNGENLGNSGKPWKDHVTIPCCFFDSPQKSQNHRKIPWENRSRFAASSVGDLLPGGHCVAVGWVLSVGLVHHEPISDVASRHPGRRESGRSRCHFLECQVWNVSKLVDPRKPIKTHAPFHDVLGLFLVQTARSQAFFEKNVQLLSSALANLAEDEIEHWRSQMKINKTKLWSNTYD